MVHRGSSSAHRQGRFVGPVLLVACLLAAPASAQTADDRTALSLDQALSLAVGQSRLVAASAAQTQASREMQVAAGRLPDPVLKVGVDNVPVDGPDQFSVGRDFMTQRSIGLMQEFTGEDKRRARSERFQREAEVGEAQRELVITQIRRDVAIAWLERSYQESARTLLQDQATEAQLQIEAAEAAYRTGRGSQVDVFAARTLLEQIHDRLSQTEQRIATASSQLSRWIGREAERPLDRRPAIDAAPIQEGELEQHVAHHPELAVLAGQQAMAQADADLARASRRPDWTWEVTYSQRGSSYSNMVSVNVSVPVPWNRSHLQDRELAARLAQLEQARAQREDAQRMHIADTQALWREWQIERSRLARYDSSLIPLAEQRVSAALAAYRGASAPLAAVLEARRDAIETKLERLNLELQTARLWSQLRYLVPPQAGVPAATR
jgi:outer membrane protein TolC